MTVGIDHIAAYFPNQYLDLSDLAQARGVDPQKFSQGLGVLQMAVASPQEDVVAMAANAGKRVLEEAGVRAEDVGLLIVGTESSVDHAKPVAVHVHELLGVNNRCRVYDIMHACAGATYGVLSALDWLQNTQQKYALVIASDIAKYGIKSAGEPTQGAGSVALLLSRNPRLCTLREMSTYSKNVYDFWRPSDEKYPIVDGVFSTQCFVEAASRCFENQELKKDEGYLYHIPYPKITFHAHTKVMSSVDRSLNLQEHYQKYVQPSVILPSRVGNTYTGGLWLALISFFENAEVKEGQQLNLFSYGSGCGSALIKGLVSERSSQMTAHFDYTEQLETRKKLSMKEYELLIEGGEFSSGDLSKYCRFRFGGIENKKRIYGRA